ncbi:MupG family TIM beta-alpha barrel fold protein [uncultured Vagococcus sp.]|uniref:DUF871 domain-containing protein n=1 Tax=uncultured Vagococcus sp. TaxID=189676 RepID=UPI0028D326A9|nr:MupG family TIM beta-alpha barrel fold protein [uncultured Vagococcus sp.]
MSKNLGISIYPEKTTDAENKAYIDLAAKYGYSRLFTCFLSPELSKDDLLAKYQPLIAYGNQKGLATYVDVYASFFAKMGIELDDLSFFQELGAAGFRLDRSFSGSEEALMSYNPEKIMIEVNLSNDTSYVDNILAFEPNKEQVVGCHNFYPQEFTGLDEGFFVETTRKFHEKGLHTAAFVTSQSAQFGPWDISEGQPTLERDRYLPMDLQARAMWACSEIDDIIVGNAFASEAELKALSLIDPSLVTLRIELSEELSPLEEQICFDVLHFQRGDISSYMVRSTTPRSIYKGQAIKENPRQAKIQPGDVLIANQTYGIYAGELQIALKERENQGQWNVIGHIPQEEAFLIEYITPWKKFKFRKEVI